jgi:hypothetical protein
MRCTMDLFCKCLMGVGIEQATPLAPVGRAPGLEEAAGIVAAAAVVGVVRLPAWFMHDMPHTGDRYHGRSSKIQYTYAL